MTPPRFLYVRVLTLGWVACVLLEFAFPGPEHALQILTLSAGGFWARFLVLPALSGGHIPIQGAMAVLAGASMLSIILIAVGLDALRVRVTVWMRSVLALVGCGVAAIFWKLFYEVGQGQTLESAAQRMELSDEFPAYVLFTISAGLLLGSAFALVYSGFTRLLRTANKHMQPQK